MDDNQMMIRSARSPLGRVARAPFSRRTWAELVYALVSALLAVGAVAFIVPMLVNGLLWGASAPGVRRLNAAARFLARALLGDDVPAPPRLGSALIFMVRTPDAARLAVAVGEAGGQARVWETRPGVTVKKLPSPRITEVAAAAGAAIDAMRPASALRSWLNGRIFDPVAWRARAYFAVKLPLAALALAVAVGGWLGGLYFLTFPVWRMLSPAVLPGVSMAGSFLLIPAGAALWLAAPWLMRGTTEPDRWLIRTLLGPSSPAERIRALQE
ncbi:MAG TPA: sensor domain-containing protein, partial [Streptosporangiaceae bacterium]